MTIILLRILVKRYIINLQNGQFCAFAHLTVFFMNDFNKSEEEKFRDWVRKSIYEIRETVHGMALEFDKQLAELREKKKAKISKK